MTSFEDIYTLFLSQIDDYEIGAMAQEDALDFLYKHLLISAVNFKECRKDLNLMNPYQNGEFTINFNKETELNINNKLSILSKNLSFEVYDDSKKLDDLKDYNIIIKQDTPIQVIIDKINLNLPDVLYVK